MRRVVTGADALERAYWFGYEQKHTTLRGGKINMEVIP
jgi:hypothetical protein